MSRRYASVDRSKEIKAKREVNPFFKSPNLKLDLEEFNINNILSTTKKSGLKTEEIMMNMFLSNQAYQ